MNIAASVARVSGPHDNIPVFERIANELRAHGFCVLDDAIPAELTAALAERVHALRAADFSPAGIGRAQDQMLNDFVRRDEIRWLEHEDAAERGWLAWSGQLSAYLNRALLLGLFSYEAHFAHYETGAFYKRHLDAFRGESNRVLTTVYYLNPGWQAEDGGELLVYPEEHSTEPLARVLPQMGRLVIFISEEFPHEVLPAGRDRYSIAGWFRVNASTAERADPPR